MVRQLKRVFDWFKVKKIRVVDVILGIVLLFAYIACSTYGFGLKLNFNFDVKFYLVN